MISQTQSTSITFILDKVFHDECIDFLCHEAHISNQPVKDSGLIVYPVNHTCRQPSRSLTDPLPIPPPAYHEIQHPRQFEQANRVGNPYQLESTREVPPELPPRNYKLYTHHCDRDQDKFTTCESAAKTAAGSEDSGNESIPPRNIARKNFESAIPAVALPYTNFQPHMFQQSSSSFDNPYQISSRIIITNSGEVQYERNVLGNKSQFHGGFHFKQDIPLPPRSSTAPRRRHQPHKRTSSSPTTPKRRCDPHVANIKSGPRASELIESDDAYVFIPDVVKNPARKPPPPPPPPSTAVDFQTDPSAHLQPSSSTPPTATPESQASTSTFECPLPPRSSTNHEPHSHLSSHSHTITHSPTLASKMHSSLHAPMSDPLKSPAVSTDPLNFPDLSVEHQPVYVSSSSADPTTHHCHPTSSLPPLSEEEDHLSEDPTTRPFSLEDSDDYDDVVIVTQQAGNVPEVRNGHLDSAGFNGTSPTLSPRSGSPSKPAVKPRLKLPHPSHTPWCDVGRSSSSRSSSIKRTLTIPRNPSLNTSSYVLNSYSTDDASSTTTEWRSLHASSENAFSSVRENKSTFLTYSPLTPPIPKPRVSFMDHLPLQYTEDDNQMRKSSSLPITDV